MWSLARRTTGVFAVGVLLCVAELCQLHAQQSGTISGTVLDQTGKPIQGAVVELKGESTVAPRNVISDADGKFLVSDLAAGHTQFELQRPVSPWPLAPVDKSPPAQPWTFPSR